MSLIEIEKKIKFKNFLDLSREEALQVLEYRNLPEIRKNMVTQDVIREDDHLKFINGLKTDKTKAYYAVVFNRELIGAVYLTDIQLTNQSALWGFYCAKRPFKFTGKIMLWGFLNFVFKQNRMNSIYSIVLCSNKKSLDMHKLFGFDVYQTKDIINLVLKKDDWLKKYSEQVKQFIESQ